MVLFSCGCIGLQDVPGGPEGRSLILKPCDGEQEVAAYWRDMTDKTTGPVPPERALRLVEELAQLVADGHRFQQIRMLLGFNQGQAA